MAQPHHRGEYPEDWPAIAKAVKDESQWHCVRCLHANCRVTGRFTQRLNAGGFLSCNIPQSTLSRDKEVVTGVGKCGGGTAIFSFNMVKR